MIFLVKTEPLGGKWLTGLTVSSRLSFNPLPPGSAKTWPLCYFTLSNARQVTPQGRASGWEIRVNWVMSHFA